MTSLKNTPTKRMEKDKSSIEILIFICLYVSANKIRFSIRRQGKNKPSWVILMVNKRGARYFPNARDRISTTSERFDQLYHESVFFSFDEPLDRVSRSWSTVNTFFAREPNGCHRRVRRFYEPSERCSLRFVNFPTASRPSHPATRKNHATSQKDLRPITTT